MSSFSFGDDGGDGDGLSLTLSPTFSRFNVNLANPRGTLDNLMSAKNFLPAFDGQLATTVFGEIPLIGVSLDFDLKFPDLNALLEGGIPSIGGNNEERPSDDEVEADSPFANRAGSLAFSIKSLGFDGIIIRSLEDLPFGLPDMTSLLLEARQLDLFVSSLDSLLGLLEGSVFGPSGGFSKFNAPFIGKGIFTGLGGRSRSSRSVNEANSGGNGGAGNTNFLSTTRTRIKTALTDGLGLIADELLEDIVGEISGLLDGALKDVNLIESEGGEEEEKSVFAVCYDVGENEEAEESDCSSDTVAILWTLPLGQTFDIDLPLDFSVARSVESDFFDLEIEIPQPRLRLSWNLDVRVGYHKKVGFFIDTAPEEPSELIISAQLDIEQADVSSHLLFLDADITGLDLTFGVQIRVDADKGAATRGVGSNEAIAGFGEDWMKFSQVASTFRDLFQISASAQAAITAGDEGDQDNYGITFSVSGLGKAGDLIPRLVANLAVQAKVSIGTEDTTGTLAAEDDAGRRLSVSRRLKENSVLHRHCSRSSDRRSARILRSLAGDDGSIFEFDSCPIRDGENFCMRVLTPALDTREIRDLVQPIIDDIREVSDPIGQPLLELTKPLPGVSDLSGTDVTVLDIAEQRAPNSGVGTVRKFLKTYESILEFADNFADGFIDIAERCEPRDGEFTCCGALFELPCDDDDDEGGDASVGNLRQLQSSCPKRPSDFTEDRCRSPSEVTDGDNVCASSICNTRSERAACKAARLACRAANVEGLTFPLFQDPASAIDLLLGGDVVRFIFGGLHKMGTTTFSSHSHHILSPSVSSSMLLRLWNGGSPSRSFKFCILHQTSN